jgi:hypothetical protein
VVLAIFPVAGSVALAQQTRVQAKGTIVSVSADTIEMKDAAGKSLSVKLPKAAKVVEVTGQMRPSQLSPGAIVRVVGTLKGNALAEPVSRITLYRPLEGYAFGVLADDPSAVVVTGLAESVKGGRLVIAAGNRKISAPLAEDAIVAIETGDHSVARPGDAIQIDARKSDKGVLTARSVKITLTIPEPAEKPGKKEAEGKAKKKGK